VSTPAEAMAALRDRVVALSFELEAIGAERTRLYDAETEFESETVLLGDEVGEVLYDLAGRLAVLSGNPSAREMTERVDTALDYLDEVRRHAPIDAEVRWKLRVASGLFSEAVTLPPGRPVHAAAVEELLR